MYVIGTMHHSPDGGWVAELSFETKSGGTLGTRKLENPSESCAAMWGPISFVVALMVDSARDSIAATESGRATATDAGPPARQGMPQSLAFADVRASFGLLPGTAFGAMLGVNVTLWAALPSRLEGTIWLPKATDQARPGGQFWGWHAGFALCPNLTASHALSIMFCGGAQMGLIHGSGFRLDYTESSWLPYGHAEARVAMLAPIWGSLALSAHVGTAVPLIRPRFAYLDQAGLPLELHRPNAIIPIVGLGIVWRESAPTHSQSTETSSAPSASP
jgi:hypothetical protein